MGSQCLNVSICVFICFHFIFLSNNSHLIRKEVMCSMDSRFLFLCCISLLLSRQRLNRSKREERAILPTSVSVSLRIFHHISKCFNAEMLVLQSVRLDRVPILTGFSSACRRCY